MTRKVLIVDDDDLIRRVVRVSLSRVAGWNVRTAGSGEECLEVLSESDWVPDVILLDYQMPGLDGDSTRELIRQRPASKEVPIIYLTAKQVEAARSLSQGEGISGVTRIPLQSG